jgi:starch phosphorylase
VPDTASLRRDIETVWRLARDLRWAWHPALQGLFATIDPERLDASGRNPVRLLRSLGRSGLEARLGDRTVRAALRRAVRDVDPLSQRWYAGAAHDEAPPLVAYFSAEFALSDALPIFAGGLGAVAGEMLKSAGELGVPMVGVGLLYRETSRQWLDADLQQQETWELLDPDELPIEPLLDPSGRRVVVRIAFPGRDLVVRAWQAHVGPSRLVLLDADVPANHRDDRAISRRLYGGDDDMRLRQELLLGVGGVAVLEQAGIVPDVYHLNEGHTAFVCLARTARLHRDGLPLAAARELARSSIAFTTHTPVAAGHDYFPPALAAPYLRAAFAELGLDDAALLDLGRHNPGDPADTFCPTVLALRTSGRRNAVSRLHGVVTREQWGGLWPRQPRAEVPVEHVTNGVHLQSWVGPPMRAVLDRALGPRWRTTPGDVELWKAIADVPDAAIWQAREAGRRALVDYARAWLRRQLARRTSSAAELALAGQRLDPHALTLGFVGRFVAYKRPTMFLRDPDRLVRLLGDDHRPVQIIFAGKAHPHDEHGKGMLRDVVSFARERSVSHRLVFLEDFDMEMDHRLAAGADVWLNTPRRPLEACGIGGMKSGANGGLNLSTLDGWWDEVFVETDDNAPVGWPIGGRGPWRDVEEQDDQDSASFYEQLEEHLVPAFYDRDRHGIPQRWVAGIKASMARLGPLWDSHRMVREYTDGFYRPLAHGSAALAASDAARARRLGAAIERLHAAWPAVRVEHTEVRAGRHALEVRAVVDTGRLPDELLRVEAWVDPGGGSEPGDAAEAISMAPVAGHPRHWSTMVPLDPDGARPDVAVRVVPGIADLRDPLPGLVRWAE